MMKIFQEIIKIFKLFSSSFAGILLLFIIGSLSWQSLGGERLYDQITGRIPWESKEIKATQKIDHLVSRIIPSLKKNYDLKNSLIGDYIVWIVGKIPEKSIELPDSVGSRPGFGSVLPDGTTPFHFTDKISKNRRPISLWNKGKYEAEFSAHAESVVIIEIELHSKKNYKFSKTTSSWGGSSGVTRSFREQKAFNYRLLVWVIEIDTGNITAHTTIYPDPLPKKFRVDDNDYISKEQGVVHHHISIRSDALPKLRTWLENIQI